MPNFSQYAAQAGPMQQLQVRIDPNYIYRDLWSNLVRPDYIEAVFMELSEGVAETATVQYAEEQVIGRPSSFLSFVGVSARTVSLMFRFHVQGGPADPAGQFADADLTRTAIEYQVIGPAKFLEALKFPLIDKVGLAHAPPPVILTLGNLLYMRAVVSECHVTWQAPWLPDYLLPYGADVQVTFSEVEPLVGNYSTFAESDRRWDAPIPLLGMNVKAGDLPVEPTEAPTP